MTSFAFYFKLGKGVCLNCNFSFNILTMRCFILMVFLAKSDKWNSQFDFKLFQFIVKLLAIQNNQCLHNHLQATAFFKDFPL